MSYLVQDFSNISISNMASFGNIFQFGGGEYKTVTIGDGYLIEPVEIKIPKETIRYAISENEFGTRILYRMDPDHVAKIIHDKLDSLDYSGEDMRPSQARLYIGRQLATDFYNALGTIYSGNPDLIDELSMLMYRHKFAPPMFAPIGQMEYGHPDIYDDFYDTYPALIVMQTRQPQSLNEVLGVAEPDIYFKQYSRSYKRYQKDDINFHELSHAQSADEAQADRMGAMRLLKKHGVNADTIAYLLMRSDVRFLFNTLNQEQECNYAPLAYEIKHVIDMAVRNPRSISGMSEDDILKQALVKTPMDVARSMCTMKSNMGAMPSETGYLNLIKEKAERQNNQIVLNAISRLETLYHTYDGPSAYTEISRQYLKNKSAQQLIVN